MGFSKDKEIRNGMPNDAAKYRPPTVTPSFFIGIIAAHDFRGTCGQTSESKRTHI
ncbi:MAG: hypothetical protein WDN30_10755 [Pararobbsia sp.]